MVRLLPSTNSAKGGVPPSLFVGFFGTMSLSDFPGLFILITVLAVNFLGDGLRDALDPTQTIERK